jgi:hypothetical protein
MEITIKISFSPEEAKESTGKISLVGPAPSLEPAISMESSLPGEEIGLLGSLPSPDLSPIGLPQTSETPIPAMMADIFLDQIPPEIPMMARELTPIPIAVLEDQGFPVPDLTPDIPSGKRSKEDKQ